MNSGNYTIDLPWDFVDHIIKTELSSAYNDLVKDIKDLNSQDTLTEYEMRDLKNSIEYRDAFRKVLSYYSTKHELDALILTE
jgi:hypothetical protein